VINTDEDMKNCSDTQKTNQMTSNQPLLYKIMTRALIYVCHLMDLISVTVYGNCASTIDVVFVLTESHRGLHQH